jgi:hypothetical protein
LSSALVQSLLKDLLAVTKTVLPLAAVLILIKTLAFGMTWVSARQVFLGVLLVTFGLFLFQGGIRMSLLPMAEATGEALALMRNRPLIIGAVFLIALLSTLVEPGLRIVVQEAEEISAGAIRANALLFATAIGVGIGMAIGTAKIVYSIRTVWIVLPILVILIALILLRRSDTMTALAFDCASATTGPVNIPINMLLALGIARSVEGVDPLLAGFGLVGLTSLGAAMAILVLSLFHA